MKRSSYDIIIVGGGMVGLTLACALAQQTTLSIAILEAQASSPTWSADNYHHRVSAIALSSRAIFKHLGIWDSLRAKRVSPFTHIQVWDESKGSELTFDSSHIAESVLGYIIENNLLQSTLQDKIKQYPQIEFIAPVRLATYRETENSIDMTTQDDRLFSAALVVAADGAQSWLREQADIGLATVTYEQEALVATVQTALPHAATARQVFLPAGPLAFLPLKDPHTCSIVWSLPPEEAQRLLALEKVEFMHALTKAFSHLGDVVAVEQRFAFPLRKQQAACYIKPRLALVGDAAHTVHPLAGQGVNMGLLDAASLTDVIVEAINRKRDMASYATLRRYERWRKADNQGLMVGVDWIKRLFASKNAAVLSLRAFGVNVTQQTQFLKNFFTRHAVGNRAGLPSLAADK